MDKIDRNFLISWKNELAKKEVDIYEFSLEEMELFIDKARMMLENNELSKLDTEFNSLVSKLNSRINLANEKKIVKEAIKSIIESMED